MSSLFPSQITPGTPMAMANPDETVRRFLSRRRSAGSRALSEPGPSPDELDEILSIAMRVPDHRKLEPWRFIVFEGEARAAFGLEIGRIAVSKWPNMSQDGLETERKRFLRAPTIVSVISSVHPKHKTPVWEQELSAGALCYNLLLAANAAGWAGAWLTEWLAFDADIAAALGLQPHERVAGFIYLGTATADNPERPRPDLQAKIRRYM